VLLKRV